MTLQALNWCHQLYFFHKQSVNVTLYSGSSSSGGGGGGSGGNGTIIDILFICHCSACSTVFPQL
jgi:hypothetical protein